MKRKKLYITLFLISVIGIISCRKYFENLNTNTKELPETLGTPRGLFSYAQKSLSDLMATPSVNYNVFRFFAQYWGSAQYQTEPSYNVIQRNIANNLFYSLYTRTLANLKEAKKLSVKNTPDNIAERAIISILEIYTFALAVEFWGDVPYTQALNIDNIEPAYDEGKTVYLDLANKLDTALQDLNKGGSGLGSADLVYGGDTTKWRKFGNSLKIKMGLMLGKAEKEKAKKMIESAKGLAFESQSDSYIFHYLSNPPNTNPYYESQILSNRHDFLGTTTFIDTLKKLGDPRLPYFFDSVGSTTGGNKFNNIDTGKYVGQIYGRTASRNTTSKPGNKVEKPDADGILMDYAEVQLYLAEACSRGLITDTKKYEYLVNGVVASVTYWKGDSTGTHFSLQKFGIDAKNKSAMGTSNCCTGTNGEPFCAVIALQEWIAFYNRGYDGWNVWRRYGTFSDKLFTRVDASKTVDQQIPQRFTYPVSEETRNSANLNQAISRIGGNTLTNKLFFFK